jgi:hypothetical protein
MAQLINVTRIPAPRVPFFDPRTGEMSREWYRFFENLFLLTGGGGNPLSLSDIQKGPPSLTVDEITAVIDKRSEDVGPAGQDVTAQIAKAVQDLATAPQPRESNTLNTNYLDFELDAPKTNQTGRVGWNMAEQTLDIGMDYGVVQNVGLELYARVENATGVTIPNGTVVGFAGVSANNVLSVTPFNADGSTPTLYILGVMTHDLPNSGEVGYCTVWGHVRDIDTSAFSVGDILYADPATPGGLTATKPTAPDAVVPVAAVLESDATTGEIFVRPTVEQQRYYGVFVKTTDQTPAAINTEYLLTFDSSTIANGVSIGTPASRIVVSESGLYNFNATVQLSSGSSSSKNVWFWFKKNGTAVANSARIVTSDINNGYIPITVDEPISLAANDYVEIAFAADDTNVTVDSVAATAFAPAAPAVVLSVTQVQL